MTIFDKLFSRNASTKKNVVYLTIDETVDLMVKQLDIKPIPDFSRKVFDLIFNRDYEDISRVIPGISSLKYMDKASSNDILHPAQGNPFLDELESTDDVLRKSSGIYSI